MGYVFSRFTGLGLDPARLAFVLAGAIVLWLPGCGESGYTEVDASKPQDELVLPAELESPPSADRIEELVESGRAAFTQKGCIACHGIDGQALTGPALADIYGKSITLQDGRVLERDLAYLYKSLVAPSQYVSSGGPVVMPPYTYLDEQTLVALVYFVRSLSEPDAESDAEAGTGLKSNNDTGSNRI